MRQTLKKALQINFGHEGGFVNAKTDRGGPTKYGITIATLSRFLGRQATVDDVRNLTLSTAEEIYRKFYWPMAGCDQLPAGLDYAMFNTAVMSGPARGVKLLQILLKTHGLYPAAIDGHFGPATMRGVENWPGTVPDLITAFVNRHLEYCRQIKGKQGWSANGRGWEYRLTGKDPKGIFKDQPGVIGYGIQIWNDWVKTSSTLNPEIKPAKIEPMPRPNEIEEQMETEALPSKPTVTDTIAKPETLSAIATLISTIMASISDSAIMQGAFASLVVVAGGLAAYTFYKRIQREEVL